jgi:hypothetical protein
MTAREALRHRWKARTLADAKAFIRLQTNMKSVHLKKGDIVYKEGDMGKSMYFVDEERGGKYTIIIYNSFHLQHNLMQFVTIKR